MRRAALPAVCLLWAGIAIGISFIEAPAKFQAPSLTLPVAVDVGRHVFAASHAVQLGLAALAVAAAVWARTGGAGEDASPSGHRTQRAACAAGGAARWILAGAVAIFLGQHLALLPALDARAAVVIAGGQPEQGAPHLLYIALEVAKIAGLIAVALISLGSCRTEAGTARP